MTTTTTPPTLCQHPGCTARADQRFTLRLRGGRVVRYCLEHWQARMTAKAGR